MTEPRQPEPPLLSPSEWLVFSAVLERDEPVSAQSLAATLADPSVTQPAAEALLERLAACGLLLQEEHLWKVAPGSDSDAVLRRQIARFLTTYIDGHPRGRALLREMLEIEPIPALR